MTSIFIDTQLRHSAVHIHAQFRWFWGNLTPKCGRPSCEHQKGTSLRDCTSEPSCVKIRPRVTSVGENREKN